MTYSCATSDQSGQTTTGPYTQSLPCWAGPDPLAASGAIAGFGIVEITFAVLFVFLAAFVLLRRLITAAGF